MVNPYGLFVSIGLIAATLLLLKLSNSQQLPGTKIALVGVGSFLFGYLGAKIFNYLLVSYLIFPSSTETNLDIFHGIFSSGQIWFAGLIAGIIFFICSLKFLSLPVLKILDCAAPAVAIGHGFGRIGCFLIGCCHGAPTDSFLSVHFPAELIPEILKHQALFPVQLFETLGNWSLAGILLILFFQTRFHLRQGNLAALYLCGYSLLRFVLEFYRGDSERGVFLAGYLSTSQTIAILVFTLGAIFLIRSKNDFWQKEKI